VRVIRKVRVGGIIINLLVVDQVKFVLTRNISVDTLRNFYIAVLNYDSDEIQGLTINKVNRLLLEFDVLQSANKILSDLIDSLDKGGIYSICIFFLNDIYFSLILPLESTYFQIEKIIKEEGIEGVYLVGGNPNTVPYGIFNVLSEASISFLFKRSWILNPYLFHRLKQDNVNVKWIKKDKAVKIKILTKVFRSLLKTYRFFSVVRYIIKNMNKNIYKNIEEDILNETFDIFILRSNASVRYVKEFISKYSSKFIVLVDFSRLPQDEIYSTFKNHVVCRNLKFTSYCKAYLKQKNDFRIDLRNLFSSLRKNSFQKFEMLSKGLDFLLEDLHTILPDFAFRRLLFEEYFELLKNFRHNIKNIYTTETFVYGSVIHLEFAKKLGKDLNFIQSVAIQPIGFPFIPYKKMFLYSKKAFEYFSNLVESELLDYVPRNQPENSRNLVPESGATIAVLTQPDEFVDVFREVFESLISLFKNRRNQSLPKFRILIKFHPRDNLRNYRKLVAKLKTLVDVEILDSLEETLEKADIFICSTTSILYDLANTQKNVVVYVPNSLEKTNIVISDIQKLQPKNFHFSRECKELLEILTNFIDKAERR